ncbi:hypothetical protein GCM10022277_35500 [Litoribacillus peritrichatus]|uniref:Type II secretion system protein GspF domain-containing protein n=1 Tax=Litoribacillus peritrichatus TaxID=718191 RepID=A0ABP7N449_9GAMM
MDECLTRVESEPGVHLYGEQPEPGSLPDLLLAEIKDIENQQAAARVIGLYGGLDFTSQLNEPMQLKRVIAYLSCVVVVFFLVSCLYQLKVAPTFLETYRTFELDIPIHVLWYQDYWLMFSVVIFVLLLLALKVGFELKRLFQFADTHFESFIFNRLTLPGIRTAYLNILEAVFYPLSDTSEQRGIPSYLITEHLRAMERSGMDVTQEIQSIIQREGRALTVLCERQMRIISASIAIIIIAAIFFFLISAYSPIFILGETI